MPADKRWEGVVGQGFFFPKLGQPMGYDSVKRHVGPSRKGSIRNISETRNNLSVPLLEVGAATFQLLARMSSREDSQGPISDGPASVLGWSLSREVFQLGLQSCCLGFNSNRTFKSVPRVQARQWVSLRESNPARSKAIHLLPPRLADLSSWIRWGAHWDVIKHHPTQVCSCQLL